jgi:hypothetical protein
MTPCPWVAIVALVLVLVSAHAAAAQSPAAPSTSPPSASSPPTSSPAASPTTAGRDATLTRASIQAQRQAIVATAMDLDDKQTAEFWPVYRAYRQEMAKVADRQVAMLTTYLEHYPELPDGLARQLLDESLRIEQARHDVRSAFLPRFRQVLPDRKVARFFQVEHRLDSILNVELAERVPLVE